MSEVTDYIYEAKKARDALKRLKNNDDFKFIIEDGYFGKYKEGALQALADYTEAHMDELTTEEGNA